MDDSKLKRDRQFYQMQKKGFEEIANALDKPIAKVEFAGASLVTIKGDKGDKGDSPSAEELEGLIKPLIPAPIKGEKGDNGKDAPIPTKKEITELLKPFIPKPIKGKDGQDGKSIKGDKGDPGNDGRDGSPDSPDEIVSKLRTIKGAWLDIDAVDGLRNSLARTTTQVGGGVAALGLLVDVDLTGVTINANGKYVLGSGTGSSILLQTNGTNNGSQSLLNLIAGTNITLTDNGSGGITIDSTSTVDTNIYTIDGTLTGDRTLTGGGNFLQLTDLSFFSVDGGTVSLNVNSGSDVNLSAGSSLIQLNAGDNSAQFIFPGGLTLSNGSGTTGQVFTSNGTGADPSWEDAATGLNIYNSDGTLTGSRTLDMAGNDLNIGDSGSGDKVGVFLDTGGLISALGAPHGSGVTSFYVDNNSNLFVFEAGTLNIPNLATGGAAEMLTVDATGNVSKQTIPTGTLSSVSGTTDRIIISGTATDPVVDIASTYIGQSSITTLGTITAGTWNGSTIGISRGGTNATSFNSRGILYYNGTSLSNSSLYVITIDGYIGHGTGTPTAQYDLVGVPDAFGNPITNSWTGYKVTNSGINFNTTSSALFSTTASFVNTSTRASGSNTLTNIGLTVGASGAQNNYALITSAGNSGILTSSPTAYLHIGAGTATAGTAPIKLTSGTNLSSIEDGAMEYNGTHLYFSIGSTRYQLDQQSGGGGGITSLNALTGATQTFATGTSGTDFGISSSVTTHTFNLPTASATNRGALSSADWTTFNSKENALTFSSGLTRTSNTITNDLSTGVSGGQTAVGGTGSGDNLTLSTTTNGTKGKIIFGSASAYDQVNDRIGISTTSPSSKLHILTTGIGSTTADSSGVYLQNNSAAANGAQQYSPSVVWQGRGWASTGSVNQSQNWRATVVPVQGTSNSTSNLIFEQSTNGGAYSTKFAFNTSAFGTGNAVFQIGGANTIGFGAATTQYFGGSSGFSFYDSAGSVILASMTNVGAWTFTPSSLTGSSAVTAWSYAQTWNTSGTPTAIKLNITDTASNAASLLADLQVGGTSKFSVAKTGTTTVQGNIIAAGSTSTVRLKGYTVATLPTGTVGDTAYVTDALAPTFLATVVGGGAITTTVFYNGTNWVAQ